MGQQTWGRGLSFLLAGLFGVVVIGHAFLVSSRWLNARFPGFLVHENLTVGPYYMPGWSGAAAGLRSLDRIIEVNDHVLASRKELYAIVHRGASGTEYRYRIARGDRVMTYTIPSMTFGVGDWFLSFGIYIIIGLVFLVIGVAPFFLRAASPAALPLCFMVLTVFIWFQTTFDFVTEGQLPAALRIFALSLTPSAAIHLALLLSRGLTGRLLSYASLALIYGIGFLLGALNRTTFFGSVEIWKYFFRLSYVYVFIGAAAFLWITARALGRAESSLERSRLRVIFVGALLGFLLPAVCTVLTSSFQLALPYNFALVPTIVFPISVAFALLKYSLFDLGQALRVTLSRTALMVVLIAIYALLALLVAPWAGDYVRDPIVPLFFSILVVAIFNPLLRWLEGIVDRYVYRQDYDSSQVQDELSVFLRTLDSAPVLAQGFIERIMHAMGLGNGVVVYYPKGRHEPLVASAGSVQLTPAMIAADHRGLSGRWSDGNPRAIAKSEAAIDPRWHERSTALLEIFDHWRSEILLPLIFESEVRGAVAFGAKRSGREYSAEDIRLLRTLVDQLALALENGRLYEESVQACRRVEESNQKLIESDRLKKDFVANICHELRTPITTIIGFGEVLRDLNVPGEARKILDKLVHNGQELSGLMDNLMNYSRMEANAAAAQIEIVELKKILAGLELMTQRLIRARPIEFGVHIDSAIDSIESDGQKLQQILVQLLTNALKFTEKGRIDLTIRSRRDGADDFLEIAVADTGIGIKREDQDLIFEDFRQLDGSSTRQYGGTGLGLGLCKKLAAALGGEIRVASEVGVGSVFSLLLPVKSVEPAARYADLAEQALYPQ